MTDDQPASSGPTTPRRRVGVVRRVLALVLLCVLIGGAVAWLLGRAVGDRVLWSQYLEWIPTESVVLLGVAMTGGVLLLSRRPRVPLVITAALGAWLLLAEWRVYRLVLPDPPRGDFRVVFMNISPRGGSGDLQPVFDANADVVVLSNVHPQRVTFEKIYGLPPEDLLVRTVGITPGEAPPGEAHMVRYGMFHVYSKHPIRRRASAHVASQDSWLEDDVLGGGGVLMVEVETPDGPFIVWAVDMPRTLGASRRRLFEQMGERIGSTDRVLAIDGVGRWMSNELASGDPLLTPDLIVGDFNTPAHAWSVGRLVGGMRPARADAGAGPAGTFPSGVPMFEIDFARLAPGTRATHLSRFRGGACRHLGLVLDLDRR